jgi:Lrp/AsnC ligand binding domain
LKIHATDLKTVQAFEAVAGYEEVIELRRMFGRPDHQMRVAVADHDAYEAFQTGKPDLAHESGFVVVAAG